MSQGHVTLPGSRRPLKHNAVRVGDVDPNSPVQVTVTLRGPELPEPDTAEPAISRSDFEREYGADPDDIAKVRTSLEGFGLAVDGVSPAARSIRVSGTAAQMEEAFHPGLGIYMSPDQGEFRGRQEDLQVPAELAGVVTGVFGLDQRRVARRSSAAAAVISPPGLGPADLEKRYSFPSGTAAGQQIGIAEFGGGYFPDDLEAFCARHGVATPQVSVVDAGLEALTLEQIKKLPKEQLNQQLGESFEVMMDVEIIAGLCPGAELFVYFASFDQSGWVSLLDRLIEGDPASPHVVSVSWGLPEDYPGWSDAAITEIDQRLKSAAQLGITICLASGDDGSGDQMEDGHAHVNYPASSAYVLSVGGTMLTDEEEVVWWQSPGRRSPAKTGSTGGGVSTIFKRPAWQDVQVASLNQGSIDGRVAPDVAALAGPPLYDLVFLGTVQPNGGTSASTPLWAALIARILAAGKPSQGPTFLTPLLYEVGPNGHPRGEEGCLDITKGNNASHPQPGIGYDAGVGYDAVSGWGVPNGKQLLASLP